MTNDAYRFIDKDPVIDVIRTAFQKKGNLSHGHILKVSYDSGVSSSAISEWLFGKTRRPQSLSTRFVLETLGVEIGYTFDDGTVMGTPKARMIPKAEQQAILKKDEQREAERAKKRKAKSKPKKKGH